jgi:hypothetical protein
LEHFKAAYDNKAFALRYCWTIVKDFKKNRKIALHFGKRSRRRRAKETTMPQQAMSSPLMPRSLALATLKARAWQLLARSAGLQNTRLARMTSPGRPTP